MSHGDEDATLELVCKQLGVESRRAGYGVPRGKFMDGTLVLTPDHLVLRMPSGAEVQRFSRGSVVGGWYAPGFAYETLFPLLQHSGDPSRLDYEPWLILQLSSRQWIVASVERDLAYELLDALAIGPRQRSMDARLYLPKSPPWLRDPSVSLAKTGLLATALAWIVPAPIITLCALMATASSPPPFALYVAMSIALWLTITLLRWGIGFVSIGCTRTELTLSAGGAIAPVRVDSIRSVEYDTFGASLSSSDTDKRVILSLRRLSAASTLPFTEPTYVDGLRLGHAVVDWALATAESRARHRAQLDAAKHSLPSGDGVARLEASRALLAGDGYREVPADERALVLLATDADSAESDRACAAAAIEASGSAESRARVRAYRRLSQR
jgi:hypothetical protein